HLRIKATGHVDVAENLEVPGLPPAVLGDRVEIATGDRAGIVDEDVDIGALGGEFVDVLAIAEVECEHPHADIVFAGDLPASFFKVGGGGGPQGDVAAFLRQHFGAGAPNPL